MEFESKNSMIMKNIFEDPQNTSSNFFTFDVCSDLIEDIAQKLKCVRDEIKFVYNIDLDENLLFLDISKEVIRVQSFLLFLSQGKPMKKTKKEEILINLSSKIKYETQRNEDDFYNTQIIQHQQIIKEYKTHLIEMKQQNNQLKQLLNQSKLKEETTKSEEKFRNLKKNNLPMHIRHESSSFFSQSKLNEEKAIQPKYNNFQSEFPNQFNDYDLKEQMRYFREFPKTKDKMLSSVGKRSNDLKKSTKNQLQLKSEIQGIDEEIEQLTQQIKQYL